MNDAVGFIGEDKSHMTGQAVHYVEVSLANRGDLSVRLLHLQLEEARDDEGNSGEDSTVDPNITTPEHLQYFQKMDCKKK